MSSILIRLALPVLALTFVSSTAEAQVRVVPGSGSHPYRVARPIFPGYVPPAPAPAYVRPVQVMPAAPVPFPGGRVVTTPGVFFGGAPDGSAFIRSLYINYLGREPDPTGFNHWMNYYNDARGDTGLIEAEFARSASKELYFRRP